MDTAEWANLGEALREHIYSTYMDTPVAERRASHWVMDPEWDKDIRAIAEQYWRDDPERVPETMLDLPMEFRKGAGPPHLER